MPAERQHAGKEGRAINRFGIDLIISGGQSGADLAGNRFAMRHKIASRIRTHKNFQPIRGEDMTKYVTDAIEVVSQRSDVNGLRERTDDNVRFADATLIFVQRPIEQTRGSLRTMNTAKKERKPYLVCNLSNYQDRFDPAYVATWLLRLRPQVLNIAGERRLSEGVVLDALERIWKEATTI